MNKIQTRDKILLQILPHVPFDGWDIQLLCQAENIEEAEFMRFFPGGIKDMLAHFSDWADREMIKSLPADFADMKIRQKVSTLVWLRLCALSAHEESIRRASSWLLARGHSFFPVKCAFKTADAIWHELGDTSTDHNYYTKRSLLAGVILSTGLYWLGDSSVDKEASKGFLDARIEDVVTIGGKLGRAPKQAPELAKSLLSKLPSPKLFFDRLREEIR